MHLSNQFRHKATSTVSGEIETVSDCAEATQLATNTVLQTSPGLMFFYLMSFLSSLLMEVSASGFDRKYHLSSCFKCFVLFFFPSPSIRFVSSETLSCPSPLRRGHLLSSLLRTLELADVYI